MKNQSTSHLFMIEPEVFHSNEQTLASNHYQSENDDALSLDEIKKRAKGSLTSKNYPEAIQLYTKVI